MAGGLREQGVTHGLSPGPVILPAGAVDTVWSEHVSVLRPCSRGSWGAVLCGKRGSGV